jgi:adenylyl-sulfate kinase
MVRPKSRNLTWDTGQVGAESRRRLLGHGGAVVWLTGLSGSGKSTIARALETRLVGAGCLAYVLDGDNVRHGLNADLGFAEADRTENIRRVGEVAALFAEAGVILIAAFISPYREGRRRAREAAGPGRFVEVHLDAPLDVCEARDPKQLYRKARAGEIEGFTGVDAPYEAPEGAELVLRTGETSVEESVERILGLLVDSGVLAVPPEPHAGPAPDQQGDST